MLVLAFGLDHEFLDDGDGDSRVDGEEDEHVSVVGDYRLHYGEEDHDETGAGPVHHHCIPDLVRLQGL